MINNALNRELIEFLKANKQIVYLKNLNSLFYDLEDIIDEELKKSESYTGNTLLKIWSIQQPLYEKKVFCLFDSKEKKSAIRSNLIKLVLSDNPSEDEEIIDMEKHVEFLLTKEDLLNSEDFETNEYFHKKIGYKQFEHILKEYNKSIHYKYAGEIFQDNINELIEKYNINEEIFLKCFSDNGSIADILLSNNLAYSDLINSKERLTIAANEGRAKTQILIPVFQNKIKELLFNNEILKNFINKEELINYVNFIDWSIIVNGYDFELLKKIINNDLSDVMWHVIENNLDLFEKHLTWIENNQNSECSQAFDLVGLINKVKLNNRLEYELPNKSEKQNNKINKV